MTPQTPTWRRHRPHKEVYPLNKPRNDGNGFIFSDDISKWFGGKKSSAERMADYRRRKKAGEVIKTRKHNKE